MLIAFRHPRASRVVILWASLAREDYQLLQFHRLTGFLIPVKHLVNERR
jgi:hypothetical protein